MASTQDGIENYFYTILLFSICNHDNEYIDFILAEQFYTKSQYIHVLENILWSK